VTLKRWAFNIFGTLLGFYCGLFIMQYFSQHLAMPPWAGALVTVLSAFLALILSMLIGYQMFPITQEEVIRPDAPRQPWAWLRPKGEGLRAGHPINKSQVVIGRNVACDVLVNHKSVSRKHAEIVRLAEGYLLRDLGSQNGTFVNGQRSQESKLTEGDTVAFGDVQFRFEAPRQVEASPMVDDSDNLSLSQLLTGDGGMSLGDTMVNHSPDASEGGTEVWRRP
jgi:hypothetical protein